MGTIVGTTAAEQLIGTLGDDLFQSLGTQAAGEVDRLVGLDGADIYDLSGGTIHAYVIDDRGRDGGIDEIVNAGALYQSASLGYQGWATAEQVGDDLVLHLPHRPYRFRKVARPAYEIEIVDHYAGTGVETLTAGGVLYHLATGPLGSALPDILAGGAVDDVFDSGAGNDFVTGNDGQDALRLGNGADVGFGGAGDDRILGGRGHDKVHGDDGKDTLLGGKGNDWIDGGAGKDVLRGNAGTDWITGGGGTDRLFGGTGTDTLDGGRGNDLLMGGRGADIYAISLPEADDASAGSDVIAEWGEAGTWTTHDTIELRGLYGPSGSSVLETLAALRFTREGDDMVMEVTGGSRAHVTVEDMFNAATHDKTFVEELSLNGAYWAPMTFMFLDSVTGDIGDDRSIFSTYGADLNEVIFGSADDDEIFGGTGTNFIWTGAGADVLIYKVGDGQKQGDLGGAISRDIVQDFDPSRDRLDFTEVAKDIGVQVDALVIGADADGDATIFLDTGDFEKADISIELRGVAMADVTEDLFLF